MDCSWVEPGILAAGSIPIGRNDIHELHKQEIRAILSLTNRPPTTFKEITTSLLQALNIIYFHIPIPDQFPPNLEQAKRILHFMHEMETQKRPLFVHCNAGVGRTGTILHLYYLAQGKSYEEAQAIIKMRRIQCVLLSDEQVRFLKAYRRPLED